MAEIADNPGDAGTTRIAPGQLPNPAPGSVRERYWRFVGPLILKFSAGALLVLLLAAAGFYTSRDYAANQQLTLHAYKVREQILLLLYRQRAAGVEARSYGLTGNEIHATLYYRYSGEVDQELEQLRQLVADNPSQLANATRLGELVLERRALFNSIISDYHVRGRAAAYADVLAAANQPRPIDELALHMRDVEGDLLKAREARTDRSQIVVAAIALFATSAVLALMLRAFLTITSELRKRLRTERRLEEDSGKLQHSLREAESMALSLRQLSSLGEMLQSCREPDEAIAVVERALPQLLPGVSGCLALINPSHNLVEPQLQWGVRGPDLVAAVFAPDDCWALRRSRPHPDLGETATPVCTHMVHAGVTAGHTLCLPLVTQGQALGVLSLVADHVIDAAQRELLLTVGDQLALAIANLRLQQSLREQSIRDPLTGLFNRRYLEASLPREFSRADRRKGQLALLMLDLDHFKRYNDRHGHDAGDALLAQFGAQLAQLCRAEDIPCRYGGEEFTVLLVDIDARRARERAEAIRAATARLELRHRGQRLPAASVSIGIAIYPDDAGTPEELKRTADQALYRAKREGRDRVVAHALVA
ncbi:MAG: GGDEF domain-containing protein [Proteobacteria bacterium]|nr:GGDEF domain-containing protein [Pseudomonadota bacterium]